MQHIHLNSTSSTQVEALDQQKKDPTSHFLLSTEEQTHGRGQRENQWMNTPHALALSFTLPPAQTITLTPLEVAIKILIFFQTKYSRNLKVKWPNDIYTQEGRKCGGILINKASSKNLIIGVGLNLFDDGRREEENLNFPLGFIFDTSISYQKKDLSLELYQMISSHRLGSTEILTQWKESCLHLNSPILYKDPGEENYHPGVFKDIGSQGQAIIHTQEDNQIKEFFNARIKLNL